MKEVKQIAEVEFQKEVIDSDMPVLVDFFAPWCGPCRALAPALEAAAATYSGRLKVVKVNVDDAQGLAAGYRIRGVPTLMFFKEGEAVDSIVGLPPASALRSKLDAFAMSTAPVGA
jgi:thioredoxin 1